MKARYKASGITSKQQKEAIRNLVGEELKRQRESSTRRLLKIVCISLHKEFGFGKERLYRLGRMVNEITAEHEDDEIYWTHVDNALEQIGISFDPEDYRVTDR